MFRESKSYGVITEKVESSIVQNLFSDLYFYFPSKLLSCVTELPLKLRLQVSKIGKSVGTLEIPTLNSFLQVQLFTAKNICYILPRFMCFQKQLCLLTFRISCLPYFQNWKPSSSEGRGWISSSYNWIYSERTPHLHIKAIGVSTPILLKCARTNMNLWCSDSFLVSIIFFFLR